VASQLLGELVGLVIGQTCFQGSAKYFADCRDPIVGHAIEQAMYLVPGGHDISFPRLEPLRLQWS
jgi:hypothetical protein